MKISTQSEIPGWNLDKNRISAANVDMDAISLESFSPETGRMNRAGSTALRPSPVLAAHFDNRRLSKPKNSGLCVSQSACEAAVRLRFLVAARGWLAKPQVAGGAHLAVPSVSTLETPKKLARYTQLKIFKSSRA